MLLNPYRFSSAGGDPNFANVSLLLHMDGANGSTTFTDSSPSPKTVTANGNAQISTAQSKFGGASAYFDGSGDYLTVPANTVFIPQSVDFTVEGFINPNNTTGNKAIAGVFSTGVGGWYFGIVGGLLRFSSGFADYNSTASVSSGVFSHVAATISSGTLRLFIDGSLAITPVNVSGQNFGISNQLRIGSINTPGWDFFGYIDDFRITKGAARYTANFTPPTAAFPNF